ncbi:MAG: hypothetical protein PVG51_12160, partial [Desulfosarcina sp.]
MGFFHATTAYDHADPVQQMELATDADVQRALGRHTRTAKDFLCLLSPAAQPYMEQMAQQA